MNGTQMFSSEAWVERLGWALVHFLWQGLSIALLYAAARRLMARRSSPNGRYVLACAALAAMMAAPLATWRLMQQPDTSPGAAYRGWLVAARMRSMLVRRAPPEWQEALSKLAAQIRLFRPVPLLVSALLQVPAVVGWLRPVVLVPRGHFRCPKRRIDEAICPVPLRAVHSRSILD
jgi:hypothetical protein